MTVGQAVRRGRVPRLPVKRFTAELYEGHSDCAVIVPFDPSTVWTATPRSIGYGKHTGYAVSGTANGEPFAGWIWFYFHEWRMVIDDAVLAAIGASPGDALKLVVKPHPRPDAVHPYKPGSKRQRSTR